MKQLSKRLFALLLTLAVVFTVMAGAAWAETSVDVSYNSCDNTNHHTVTYLCAGDKPVASNENYTQGSGSLKMVAKEDTGNCFFIFYGPGAVATGATHLVFDLWVPRDNILDGADGWTDMYAWNDTDRQSDSMDADQGNATASICSGADYGGTAHQAFRATYAGLKAGWNTVVMPLDATITSEKALNQMRLRLGSCPNVKTGDVLYIDDIRFVSEDVVNNVLPDQTAAKKVTGALTQGIYAKDTAAALADYEKLTDAQKAYVPANILARAKAVKTGVDVSFRNFDEVGNSSSYYKDNALYLSTDNFVEGTGAVYGEVKEDAQDLYLFLPNNGTSVDASGATYLTMDVWVPADNYFDGASTTAWSDVRGDDAAHANQWGEYDGPILMSGKDNAGCIRVAMTGLKAGWNHVVIALDDVVVATDLVSMRLRISTEKLNTVSKTGDKIYFDDIRLVSEDMLTTSVSARNAAKDVTVQIRALSDPITIADREAVNAAKAAYDNVDDAYKALVVGKEKLDAALQTIADLEEEARKDEEAKVAAAKVDEKIEAIGTVTLDSETAIDEARAAYNGLDDKAKACVTKLGVLEQAEADLASLKVEKANKEAAAVVEKAIADLPDPVDLSNVDDVAAVRAQFNGLTDAQKNYVTNQEKLNKAEADLVVLADKAAAQKAIDAINALSATVTADDKAAVTEARKAYNSLTDAQKAYVSEDLVNKLVAAEEALDTLPVDGPVFVVDGKLDEYYIKTDSDENMYYYSSMDGLLDTYNPNGWDIYDGPTDTDFEIYTAYDDHYVYVYARAFDDDLHGIDEPGIDGDVNKPDSISLYFDPDPLSAQLQNPVQEYFYQQCANPNQGDVKLRVRGADLNIEDFLDVEKVGYGMLLSEYFANTQNLTAFYFDDDNDGKNDGFGVEVRFPRNDDASGSYKLNFANGNYNTVDEERYVWSCGPSWWMTMNGMLEYYYEDAENPFVPVDDAAEAAEVEALIDALPVTVTDAPADERAITDARKAYDALTDTQKALVTNLDKLEKAEADLAALKAISGDLNGDGTVDAKDALAALKHAVGKPVLSDDLVKLGDLNGDGILDAKDALAMLKIAVGK